MPSSLGSIAVGGEMLQLLEQDRDRGGVDGDAAADGRIGDQRSAGQLPRGPDPRDLGHELFDGQRFCRAIEGDARGCRFELARRCAAAGVDGDARLDVGGRHGPARVDRDDGARGQGGRAPRDLVGEAQRRVELDGLAAADSARRQRQTGHAVAQLVGVLAPVDVAVDDADALDREVRGCCRAGFCRCGGRRRARRVERGLASCRVARRRGPSSASALRARRCRSRRGATGAAGA